MVPKAKSINAERLVRRLQKRQVPNLDPGQVGRKKAKTPLSFAKAEWIEPIARYKR